MNMDMMSIMGVRRDRSNGFLLLLLFLQGGFRWQKFDDPSVMSSNSRTLSVPPFSNHPTSKHKSHMAKKHEY